MAPRPRGAFFCPELMLPDLEQLIRLQQLENSAAEARTQIDELPGRLEALDGRIAACTEMVSSAKECLEKHRAERQTLENELAPVQTRLSRFKDQLMAVKTNKEYQAMQAEIAGGEAEIHRLEDLVLEQMLEADDLAEEVRKGEQQLSDERAATDAERETLEQGRQALEEQLRRLGDERLRLAGHVSPQAMSLFETVARQRRGLAVVEARGGFCSSCQVRLRPQLFNDILLNDRLIQCESCRRILYYDPNPGLRDRGAVV